MIMRICRDMRLAMIAHTIIRRSMRRTFEHDCDRKYRDESNRTYAAKNVHIETLTQGLA